MWGSYIFRKGCNFWHSEPISCQKRCSKIQKIWHQNEALYGQQISSHICSYKSFLSGMLCCVVFTTKLCSLLLILKSKYQASGNHFSHSKYSPGMERCLSPIMYNLCIFCIYRVHPGYQAVEHLSHFHFLKIALKEMLWRRIRGKCISISKALFNQQQPHRLPALPKLALHCE